jgi:hypothetical protein
VVEAKALARRLPAESTVPLARWPCPELAAGLTTPGIAGAISVSTVRRWLAEDVLKDPAGTRDTASVSRSRFRTQGPSTSVRDHVQGGEDGDGQAEERVPANRERDLPGFGRGAVASSGDGAR